MQTKTALAVAGSVLAVPSTALAAAAQDTDTTGRGALRASGRLTLDADHKAASCARTCAWPAARRA